jgi:hypothetical protein
MDLEARVGIERVFIGHQPQYPDFRGYYAPYFMRVQAIFATTHQLPATHTPHARLLKKSLKVSLKVFSARPECVEIADRFLLHLVSTAGKL